MGTCPAKDDPNTSWPGFCPNFGADVFYIVLFLGITIVHLVQGVMYRKFYSAVVIMAAIWQTAAYIFRAISIKKPTSVPMYSAWFILILVCTFLPRFGGFDLLRIPLAGSSVDQCLRLYGARTHGVQLHGEREDISYSSVAICSLLRAPGYRVGLLPHIRWSSADTFAEHSSSKQPARRWLLVTISPTIRS